MALRNHLRTSVIGVIICVLHASPIPLEFLVSFRVVLALSAGFMLAAPLAAPLAAQQAIKNRITGLTSSALVRTLPFTLATDLDEIDGALAAAHGVTFENAVFLADPTGGAYPIPNGAATIGVAFPTGDAITMSFASPIAAIAFQAFAQVVPDVSETRFEAYSGTTLLSSFSGRPQDPLLSSTQSLRWWGFEGGIFDRLVIWAPTTRDEFGLNIWGLGLTNITIADVPSQPVQVPEPGVIMLLAAGAVGLTGRLRSPLR